MYLSGKSTIYAAVLIRQRAGLQVTPSRLWMTSNPLLRRMDTLNEATTVTNSNGLDFSNNRVSKITSSIDALPTEMQSSMLVNRGRKARLELPLLSGIIAESGPKLGTPLLFKRVDGQYHEERHKA